MAHKGKIHGGGGGGKKKHGHFGRMTFIQLAYRPTLHVMFHSIFQYLNSKLTLKCIQGLGFRVTACELPHSYAWQAPAYADPLPRACERSAPRKSV